MITLCCKITNWSQIYLYPRRFYLLKKSSCNICCLFFNMNNCILSFDMSWNLLYGTNAKTRTVYVRNAVSINQSINHPYPSVGQYCRGPVWCIIVKCVHVGYFSSKNNEKWTVAYVKNWFRCYYVFPWQMIESALVEQHITLHIWILTKLHLLYFIWLRRCWPP